MDDPNITMEEYIRLEEEKAQKRGKVFNWETTKYGKIWYDEEVHDLISVETEFLDIVFSDNLSSNETLSCEPTISSLNNNEIDFQISFDKFDDEDYTIVFDKNSFSYKIISTYDLKTDSENDNEKVNMPLFPSPEPLVSCIDDLDFFKDFENEFPAIVYNDALTSKLDFSIEPTLCPQHIDEFDLKDETSLSEYDEVEQNVLYFNDLFPFNIIYLDDQKLDKDNGDNEIDMIRSSRGDEVYFSFGRHLDELYVTWAHLEKKQTRLRTNTKTLEDLCSQSLETALQAIHDAVTTHQVTASHHFMTASARTVSNANLEDSSYDSVLENQLLSALLLICLGKCDCVERIPSADGNLRELSGKESWETIENFAHDQKEWDNPPNIIFEQKIENLKVHAKRLFGNENVWIEMHRNIAWDKVENLNLQNTPQVPPSFEEATSLVTYPGEVDETIGTPIEVEPLNEIKLEKVGLNCNHNTPLSSREVPSFDGPES
ncbi:hypothetical protein Tco_0992953 [Tanacetum coccineum]|uniref:Uncharacterized protein n=1 Tax=Tanacetum coccineum TaxID=301880 RepID=A0ABQ5F430_9ASTR